jgi:hypothetical protein
MSVVYAATPWNSNGHLIADVAKFGYLGGVVVDATYGRGTFWTHHKPDLLAIHDIRVDGVDFRNLPEATSTVDTVVLDPPYKLNGTPDPIVDERYGTDEATHWRERMCLIFEGITEAARVLNDRGHLLLKCQDQVCSGHVRWQTIEFTNHARWLGLGLVDSFLMLGGRPQPPGTRQVHARRNYSTLLVFQKGALW